MYTCECNKVQIWVQFMRIEIRAFCSGIVEVQDITCNVFGGTLNFAQSINHGSADTNDDIPANSLLYRLLLLNDQMKFFEMMAVMFLSLPLKD